MSEKALEELRERVHGDPELAQRLAGVESDRFPGEVLRLAAALELDVTQRDLDTAATASRSTWLQRWVR